MSHETKNTPVDLSRRRLAKGGLAAPIVLATLASKNALAAPYHCTISGQLSGNVSPRGDAGESCDLGPSVSELTDVNSTAWGTVNKTALFKDIFNGSHSDVYYVGSGGRLRSKTTASGAHAASLFEVMTITLTNSSNPPPDLVLGRAAIAAYVGWALAAPNYPLSDQDIKTMFDHAIQPVDYPYPSSLGTVNLSRDEVVQYFSFLSGGPAPIFVP